MKISILTPSFNSGKYIERAILSVGDQDYGNSEHIIVDGGSTDNTLEVLEKYPHLKCISEPDKGQSDAMNKAFEMSDGEIIMYLNSDDTVSKGTFSEVIEKFSNTYCDMIVGDLKIKFEDREIIRTPSTKYADVIDFKKNQFPANPLSYYYKREIQDAFGLFPVDEHSTMDLEFIWFAYKFYKVEAIDHLMGTFYMWDGNKTSKMNIRRCQNNSFVKFTKKYDKIEYCKYYLNQVKRKVTFYRT